MPKLETSFERLQVWFLTGSIDLYGEETLRQVQDQSQELLSSLKSQGLPIDIVWKPVLLDATSMRNVILEANANDDVVGIISWMHTFSPAKMWITAMKSLQKPLLHLHTQVNVQIPWEDLDFDFMNLNQSAHGDREYAYVLSRLSIPRKTVVGHVSDPAVKDAIEVWQRAAAGWAAVNKLAIARFGDNMRGVAVTEGDKTEAQLRFGVKVNTWGVGALAAAIDAVGETETKSLIEEYLETYDVAGELRPSGARSDSLRYAAQMEIALLNLLEEGDFGAFTTTFEDLTGIHQVPGLAVQRLMAAGYGFGPEGDWKTAILVRAAKVMGHGLPGGASLMEDYTYDLTPGNERILGAHMLEICPSLTSSKPKLEIHPLGIGGKEDPVRLVFDADPGRGVVASLTDMRERFRITANTVEVTKPSAPLAKLPVGRAVWKPEPDFTTSATSWLMAGGAHHTVLTTQVDARVLQDFADMAQTELLLIDEATTTKSFEKELRWNQAYYRLAQGM